MKYDPQNPLSDSEVTALPENEFFEYIDTKAAYLKQFTQPLGQYQTKHFAALTKGDDGPRWEYLEELPQSNILEFNGVITRDMLIGVGAISKLNVHLILNPDTMTWDYGPDNQDYGWLGEGRQIYIQGIGVSLGNKQNTEGGYSWEYL